MLKIKSKNFWLVTILLPIVSLLIVMLIISLSITQKKYLIVDVLNQDKKLSPALAELPLSYTKRYQIINTQQENAINLFLTGYADALVIIPDSFIENNHKTITILSKKSLGKQTIDDILNDIYETIALSCSPSFKAIKERLNSDKIKFLSLEKKKNTDAKYIVSIGLSFFVFMFISGQGIALARSLNEEKNNKLLEIILLNIPGWKFIYGKIIGVFLVGITQAIVWGGIIGLVYGGVNYKFKLYRFDAINFQTTYMATENKDEAIELNNLVATLEYMFLHKLTLLVFVIMLLAGFLLYATMFVEIGLKSDQNTDIQKNIMLILLPLLVAILLQQWIAYEPKGLLSQLLLYFPLTTPITTVFLYSLSELSTEQIILACMILIFSITLQLYKLDNKLKKSLFN